MNNESPGRAVKGGPSFGKIWRMLPAGKRRAAVRLWLLMMVGMMLEMLGVGLVIPVIALLAKQDLAASYPAFESVMDLLGQPAHETLIIWAMLALAGVYLVKNLFLAFLAWQHTQFAFGIQAELSQQLYSLYLHQPYTFHLQRNSAQLIRNVHGELGMLVQSAITPSIVLLTEGLILFGLCALLLIVEPLGTLMLVALLGIAARLFQVATKEYVGRWGKARQHHDGKRMQHLHQGLGGAKDVKIFGREKEFVEQYRYHAVQSARMNQMQTTLQQFPRLWLELVTIMGLSALVLSMLAQGRIIASILPTLGLFAAAAFRLLPSANRLISAIQLLRYSQPVVDLLHKELDLAMPTTNGGQKGPFSFRDCLQLDDVTYTYPRSDGQPPALNHVSLTIRKGESIGFVGASGSGKSTLVDVILGLLLPNMGRVIIDGQEITRNLRAWQDQIGYVPQSIYLTDDTLRHNIAFGLPDTQIDQDAVWRAIKAAQLEEFVQGQAIGLDTVVGERGVKLSGGQRQRIGIARALYHDPDVLVLDEATSALDMTTEAAVMEAITALKGKKTILIVAHRLSTVEQCDRLYHLDQGCLKDVVSADGK